MNITPYFQISKKNNAFDLIYTLSIHLCISNLYCSIKQIIDFNYAYFPSSLKSRV